MDKFNQRNIVSMSIPSVCDYTKDMIDKRFDNTVGARYVTINTYDKCYFNSIKSIDTAYYKTVENDYIKPKVLRLSKEGL